MNKKQKKTLERILIAVALVIVLKLLPALPMPVELALYCIPYLVVGWDVLRKALKGIKNRQPFDTWKTSTKQAEFTQFLASLTRKTLSTQTA